MSIGEDLKNAREERGISLREAEESTKIRIKYLMALETEDFEEIPGRVYVIGFLRTYAKYLGMNAEEMVNRFKILSDYPHKDEYEDKPIFKKSSHNIYLYIVVIFIFNNDPSNNSAPESSLTDNQEAPQPSDNLSDNIPLDDNTEANNPPDESKDLSEQENTDQLSLTINIKESNCWLDVKSDGKESFRGILSQGDSRTFTGTKKITVKYGNAGVAEAIFNGNSIYPVGEVGQVVEKEYEIAE